MKREEKEELSNVGKKQKCVSWAHFDLLPRESQLDNELRARCKYCGSKIKCDSSQQGTSGLNKHLLRCRRNPNRVDKSKQSMLASTLQGANKTLSHHLFNQEDCRKSVAMWIILDEMPFRAVEGEGFKRMMNQIEPRFQIPSRSTITRDCLRLHMEESIKLKRYFKKTNVRVSLTTDTWTSLQNANYMCLTAHWIDEDWTYQNGCQFKVLSLIARDVLAMPVSTVSSESAFSTGGRVISEYRSSLSPNTVQALICTQNWLSPSRLCEKLQELYIDNYNDTHGEEQEGSRFYFILLSSFVLQIS